MIGLLHHHVMNTLATHIRALTFDIFGTVVDWRSSIIGEGQALQQRLGAAGGTQPLL